MTFNNNKKLYTDGYYPHQKKPSLAAEEQQRLCVLGTIWIRLIQVCAMPKSWAAGVWQGGPFGPITDISLGPLGIESHGGGRCRRGNSI